MKVIIINTVSGIGSTGRIASDIANMLIARGNECEIAYGIEPCTRKDISYRIGNNLSVKLHSAISQVFDAEGLGSILATKKLIKYIKAYTPDIIHLHNIHGCYLNYPILFKYLEKSQIPVLWTLHDCWAFTGHCAYFDYVGCDKWKEKCFNCPQSKIGYPRNLFIDASSRNFEYKKRAVKNLNLCITTPSAWLKNLVKQSFLGKYETKLVYNGIDSKSFYKDTDIEDKYNIADKKLLLAVASDWDRRKGIDDMLSMANSLPSTHIILAIGNNAPCHKNIISLKKTESIDELRKLYSRADCLINPTYEDNFPMVNIESLACGTPVCVYDTGGCSEIIDDSVGKLIQKGSYNELLESAINISNNKQNYIDACLMRAKNFDKNKCYEKYLKIYEELIR